MFLRKWGNSIHLDKIGKFLLSKAIIFKANSKKISNVFVFVILLIKRAEGTADKTNFELFCFSLRVVD